MEFVHAFYWDIIFIDVQFVGRFHERISCGSFGVTTEVIRTYHDNRICRLHVNVLARSIALLTLSVKALISIFFLGTMNTSMAHIQKIGDALWRFDSEVGGPLLVISGGIHGNEQTGIEVVNRLRDALCNDTFHLVSGSLILLHGNLEAIKLNKRWSLSAVDLNRCFGDASSHGGAYEVNRAKEIKEAIAIERRAPGTVYGVDIHATNKPSVPFLVLQPSLNENHALIASYIPSARAILSDPDWIFTDGIATFDDYLNQNGNAAFCYETGQASDTSRINEVMAEMVDLATMLGIVGISTKEQGVRESKQLKDTYILRKAILLTEAGFSYADGRGEYTFQPFSKGELIGKHGETPLIASFDGVFIFPKLSDHWKINEPVGYLAEKVLLL